VFDFRGDITINKTVQQFNYITEIPLFNVREFNFQKFFRETCPRLACFAN